MPKAKQVADKAALADGGAATQDGKAQPEQPNGAARKGALESGAGTLTRAAPGPEDAKKRAHSAREAGPSHSAREAGPSAAPKPSGSAPGHAGSAQRTRSGAHKTGEARAATHRDGDARATVHGADDEKAEAHEAGAQEAGAESGAHEAAGHRAAAAHRAGGHTAGGHTDGGHTDGANKRQPGRSSSAKKASPEGGRSHRAARVPAREPTEAVDNLQDSVPELAPDLFLEHQVELLRTERDNYLHQAEELRAQAEALALEHEPGDVQFDEEGGEGGTANVDRELDLHLSAQAQAAIEEIDLALAKIAAGTYGRCESCGSEIPSARLEALPHARLCVSCKSGGLTARRQ